jgi:SAM-dependent methyltransferase
MHAFLPEEAKVFQHLAYALRRNLNSVSTFSQIYQKGLWTGIPDDSGAGSSPEESAPYIQLVNGLLRLAEARSVLDLGTGDGRVFRQISAPSLLSAVGIDCYAPHVDRLNRECGDRLFRCLDIFEDREKLPSAEVVLLKDVLHHWPNKLVTTWLEWLMTCGKYRFAIVTSDCQQTTTSQDCHLGGWRGLRPDLPPLKRFNPYVLTHYANKAVLLFTLAADRLR